MANKGYAVMIDSLIAVIFLLLIVTAVFTVEFSKTSRTDAMSFKELHYVSEDVLDVLNKKGVLDEVAILWAENSTSGSEEMENASAMAKDYLEKMLPSRVGYELVVEEGLDRSVIVSSNESRISWNYSSTSTHSTRILVGYGSGLPTFAHVSSASLSSLASKAGSDYAYFGGFVGQGNISRFIDLPSDANITNVYLELNPASDFDLYVNGQFCASCSGTGWNLSAKSWDLTSCKNLFSGGRNWISINFTSTDEDNFVGGGFLRVDYLTEEWDRIPDFTTYWFPGVKGLINVYSGFYVPGSLQDIEVYLHYFHDLPEINTYVTIGNETVYENDTLGEVNVTLDWDDLSGFFGGDPELVFSLSNKTVPLKWGTDEFAVMASGKGTADAVLITDVSGSMGGCDVDSSCAAAGLCDSLSPCHKERVAVAKDVDKLFVNQMLNTSGTRVGLTAYGSSVISGYWHPLSSDNDSLISEISTYDHNGGCTCISCGINNATGMLLNAPVIYYDFFTGSNKRVWLYNVDYPNSEPPLDVAGVPWMNLTYNDSDWSSGETILGFEDIPYSPNVDTDIGNNLNFFRANLWDMAADLPQPVDFDTGVNSTANTFGPGAGDDGWDNQIGAYYGSPGLDVSFSRVIEGGDFRLRISAEGRDAVGSRPASGAYGVQFYVDQSMLDTVQNGGRALFSFRYYADAVGLDPPGENYQILARFGDGGGMSTVYASPWISSDTAWNTQNIDVTSEITAVGSYYLDFGVAITACSLNTELVYAYFDDIDLVITNETGNYFFRKSFTVSNPGKINKTKLYVLSDDRADVYLNGVLIDSDPTEHDAEKWNRDSIDVDKSYLVEGNNVIAVKLHNNDAYSAKFDLELTYSDVSERKKAMLVMSDGWANTVIGGGGCAVAEGCTKTASVQAINKACEARQYGIDVYSVAFGSGADPCTLKKIACWNCSACDPKTGNVGDPDCWLPGESYDNCSRFYGSNDADELAKIYGEIADLIANATLELQVINITFGDVSLDNVLYPDSYIRYTVGVEPSLWPGETLLNLESSTFDNNISNGTFLVPTKTRPIEAKVTSYSGPYWTNSLKIKSSNTGGVWSEVYDLTADYSSDYRKLGDPYVINIPASDVGVGENFVEVRTGSSPTNYTGGSEDDRVIYSVAMKTYTGIGEPKQSNEGCNWTIEFYDGSTSVISAPYGYSGPQRCSYNSTNVSYNKESAVDDAVYRLFSQLDEDQDHRLDVKFDPNSIVIDTKSIGGVRSLWGPVRLKLILWT